MNEPVPDGEANSQRLTEGDAYTIRPFQREDVDDFLSLYEATFGPATEDWFTWKYLENPYVDQVPMYVADTGGTVVGACPFFALPLRVGNDTVLALQPADAVVAPEHRRQGLLTRMTEAAIDHYEQHDASVFFNFPNHSSKGAFEKLGWVDVGAVTTHYRVQDPVALAPSGSRVNRLGTPGTALTRAYHAVRDRLTRPTVDGVTVETRDSVPAIELASLYTRGVPREIHAVRDEGFYRWRFGNPDWRYTTYLAQRNGQVVAGIVTASSTADGDQTVKLVDALPMHGDGDHGAVLSHLASRALSDYRNADVVAAWDGTLPADVLERLGFRRDDRLPVSKYATPTVVIARGLEGEQDSLRGIALDDRQNWRLSFVEQDTS